MQPIDHDPGSSPEETRPLRVVGEANGSANPFVQIADRLIVGETEVILDLSAFLVEDDFALAQCVNALRELLIRGARIAITGPPRRCGTASPARASSSSPRRFASRCARLPFLSQTKRTVSTSRLFRRKRGSPSGSSKKTWNPIKSSSPSKSRMASHPLRS